MKQILVGTSKGLVLLTKDQDWKITSTHFLGFPIAFVYVDERSDTWWVGLAHRHWGPKLHRSQNQGETWEEVTLPKYPKSEDKPTVLKKMWCMHHAGLDRPGELWLGTEPGALFHSKNNGDSFEIVKGLWEHPSRTNAMQWFGAGRDQPFLHSIVVNPDDNNHIYIAVSCAGVFETRDRGITWSPKNNGLIAAYLPNPTAEVGHDPHLLLQSHQNTQVLWQQNHCGVFRTINGGENWDNISDQNGLADYGFSLAIDPNDPLKAWVIPAISDEMRVAKDLALVVSHTVNGGISWQALRSGLPQDHCFDIVFRHAFQYKNGILAFGTNNGNFYLSEDDGHNWNQIASNLSRIDAVVII